MDILSSTINNDGDYELLVEFSTIARGQTKIVIPERQKLVDQGNAEAAALTDAAYLANAVKHAAQTLETPAVPDPAAAARAAALKGTKVLP